MRKGGSSPPSHVDPTSAQRLRAAGLRAAVFLRAAGLRAAVFLRAAGLRAAVFLRAADSCVPPSPCEPRASASRGLLPCGQASCVRPSSCELRASRAAVFFRAAGFLRSCRLACGCLPASAPASGLRSSSEPRACERRSSCEPPASGLPVFFRAVVFLAAAMLPSLRVSVDLQTPYASGADAPVHSSRPTRRNVHRGGGRKLRHSIRTGHSLQIRLASLDEPPFSGEENLWS